MSSIEFHTFQNKNPKQLFTNFLVFLMLYLMFYNSFLSLFIFCKYLKNHRTGVYWSASTTFDYIFYKGDPHVESVIGAFAMTALPSGLLNTTVRKNLPVLGFCVALDCWHVVTGMRDD